jgi:putative membrane protein
MKTTRAFLGVMAAMLLGALPALPAQPRSPGKTDQAFMKEAASGGMMEVELGRIATRNAASEKVKQFGQRMVDDHQKANDELKALAMRESVALPGSMNREHRQTVDRLSKLHGSAFDRAYLQAMLEDHEKDVAKFRREAESAEDPDLKDFAARTLPTLEKHLELAKDVSGQTGRATAGTRRSKD